MRQNTAPKGLTPKTVPALGNLAPDLAERWTTTITNASRNFLAILAKQCQQQLTHIRALIGDISLTGNENDALRRHIEQLNENLRHTETRKQVRARSTHDAGTPTDSVSPTEVATTNLATASERTSVPPINIRTNRETTDTSTSIVDISRSLSPSDTEVLARGLTFYPTLNTISEYEIHKGISDFAR